jgi:hypothetical protein
VGGVPADDDGKPLLNMMMATGVSRDIYGDNAVENENPPTRLKQQQIL